MAENLAEKDLAGVTSGDDLNQTAENLEKDLTITSTSTKLSTIFHQKTFDEAIYNKNNLMNLKLKTCKPSTVLSKNDLKFDNQFYGLSIQDEDEETFIPWLKCKTCKKYFRWYKLSVDHKILGVTASAVTSHKCAPVVQKSQQSLAQFLTKQKLSQSQRKSIGQKYVELLGRCSSVPISTGTKLLNDFGNYLFTQKPSHLDLSRQFVSNIFIEEANKIKAENLKFYTENCEFSSIIIDHTTLWNYNYISIISVICLPNFSTQNKVLEIRVASSDKSAIGIKTDISKYIEDSGNVSKIIIADNCRTILQG